MLRVVYTTLLRLVLPVVALLLWWRGRRDPARRVSLRERMGRGRPRQGPQPVWVHAVSVGEVQAAAGIVRLLRERDPNRPVLLTMATATGRQRAKELYRDPMVELRFAPFDLPGAARRFLKRERPCLAVLLETELWPNLLFACSRQKVPVALVSARLSARSQRRYGSFAPKLIRRTLRLLVRIGAQSDDDAARFLSLGADPSAVRVTGNVKFDFSLPADLDARVTALRERWIGGRRAWVAGSTHAGEESVLIEAQRLLAGFSGSQDGSPLLVMAPRHPERFETVAQGLTKAGLQFVRRSDAGAGVTDATQVLLLDTLGELLAFYAMGEVAYVGGSLVPIGGHNLLEPALLAKPVMGGPYFSNSPEAADRLKACGALRIVHDAGELSATLAAWLADPAEAARQGQAGRVAVESNRGAAARSLALLEPWLPQLL
ncbi:MAG: hypothetical protein RLZZ200_2368 [Pseudomonadota bacterium]|jgi:3-deoxy-D-manno-octulosonic-acid transferase